MFWYCCLLLSEYLGMVWFVGVLYVALPSFKIAQTKLKCVKSCCGGDQRNELVLACFYLPLWLPFCHEDCFVR